MSKRSREEHASLKRMYVDELVVDDDAPEDDETEDQYAIDNAIAQESRHAG